MNKLKTLSQDELDALREKYEYNSRIFPESDSLLELAQVYLSHGEITRARSAVSDFREKRGDSSLARVVLARAHIMCCKTVSAEDELKEALRLDPRNKQASDLLVDMYRKAGKWSEAFSAALCALSDSPPDARREDVGQPEESPAEPEKKSRPRAGVFETDTMLNLYLSQGLYKDALQIVEVLCESEPDNQAYREKREEIIALLGR